MPEIRPVTRDNWRDLARVKVREAQKNFVAQNVYSIAESQFGAEHEGHWDLYPVGIFDGDLPVGLLMYGLNLSHPKTQAFIIRLMVDENHQWKGYGRFGMEKMLEIFRADGRIQSVGISYEPENELAKGLYARLGFVETREIDHGEAIAVLKLR